MSACRSCGASVVWRRTPADKSIPLDPTPSALLGNVVLKGEGGARVLAQSEIPAARKRGDDLYVSHFVTCPNAKRHRRG